MAVDETTRKQKTLVMKAGTDRLLVDAAGVTLTTGDITLDMTVTNNKLDSILSKQEQVISLLTQIATNTGGL